LQTPTLATQSRILPQKRHRNFFERIAKTVINTSLETHLNPTNQPIHMKKITVLAFFALTAIAFATGACKSKSTPAPAPAPQPGYVDQGK
jgi:hypothetical protein